MSTAILVAASMFALLEPSEIDSLLADTQGNEAFWRDYLTAVDGRALEAAHYLLSEIPRLDRLEMTESILSDHIFGAIESQEIYYDSLPDSIFFQGLVEYRVSEEPVTAFRAPLMALWQDLASGPDTTAESVAERLAERIGELEVRKPSFLGGISSPLDALSSNGGTPGELRVLFGASLRSLGIASRSAHGYFSGLGETGWMEIWNGNVWVPIPLPSDSIPAAWAGLGFAFAGAEERTEDLVPSGMLILEPAAMIPESTGGAISIQARGMWVPIDYLEFYPTDPCTLTLGEGQYLLQLARRLPSGAVDLWTDLVDIRPGLPAVVSLAALSGGAR
jgi:hypothetical protein